MLTIEEAEVVRQAAQSSSGAKRAEYESLLNEQEPQIKAQITAKRTAYAESMYGDITTLNGKWTKEEEARAKELSTDVDEDRARKANNEWIAALGEKTSDEINTHGNLFVEQAGEKLFGKKMGHKEFYVKMSEQIKKDRDHATAVNNMRGMAFDDAFSQAISGKPAEWGTGFTKYRDANKLDENYSAVWRKDHAEGYQIALRNKELFTLAKDVMVRQSGRTDVESKTPLPDVEKAAAEAAARLAELPPEERKNVFRMFKLWGDANGGAKGFVEQLGESIGRGAGDLVKGLPSMVDDSFLNERKKRLLSGEAGKSAGIDVWSAAQNPEQFSADGVAAQIKEIDKRLSINQVIREMRQTMDESIDPIRADNVVESATYGLGRSLPFMAAVAIPYAGIPMAAAGMASQEYDKLRLKHPNMKIEDARNIAIVSGSLQAFTESVQLKGATSFLRNSIDNIANAKGTFAKQFVGQLVEQNVQEAIQDVTTPGVHELFRVIDKEIPEADIQGEWQAFKDSRLEVALVTLPLVLLGAGGGAYTQAKFNKKALSDPVFMEKLRIDEEKAAEINRMAASGDIEGAGKAFKEEWSNVSEKDKKAFVDSIENEVESTRETQESPETPTVVRTNEGKFEVTTPDGQKTVWDNEENAITASRDWLLAQDLDTEGKTRELVAAFNEQDPNRQFEMVEASALANEADVSVEQLAERMKIAGIKEGESFRVQGKNVAEIKENLYTDTSKISTGANVMDVMEERGHSEYKKALHEGRITEKSAKQAAELWAKENPGFAMTDDMTDEQKSIRVDEAIADMVRAKINGNLKKIKGIPASIRAYIARMAVYFKEFLKKAAKLKKMEREGVLPSDIQEFLAKSVGLESEQSVKSETVKAANKIISHPTLPPVQQPKVKGKKGKKAPKQSDVPRYQIGRSPQTYSLVERMAQSDLEKSLDEQPMRIKNEKTGEEQVVMESELREVGKKKEETPSQSIAPGTHIDDIIKQMSALMQNPKERLRIYAKIQAQLAAMKRVFDSNLKVFKNKLDEDKEQMDRNRQLQAIGTLEAIIAAMPAEIRGTVKGATFAKIMQAKTSKARTELIKKQVDKLDTALEKVLRTEYKDQFKKLFKQTEPKEKKAKTPGSRIGPEAQDFRDKALLASKLSTDELANQITLLEAQLGFEVKDGADPLSPEKLAETAERLGILYAFGDLKNRTARELAAAFNQLSEVVASGKNNWRTQEEARLAANRELSESGINKLGKATPQGLEQSKQDDKSLARTMDSLATSHYAFHQKLAEVFGKDHPITKRLSKLIRHATNKFDDDVVSLNKRFRKKLADFLGLKDPNAIKTRFAINKLLEGLMVRHEGKVNVMSDKQVKKDKLSLELAQNIASGEATAHGYTNEERGRLQDELDAIEEGSKKEFITFEREINTTPKPLTMTKLDAIQFILSWNQPDVREKMEKKGFTEDSIAEMEELISDDESQVVKDFLTEEYAKGYEKTNPVYRRMFGMNMARVENYAATSYHTGNEVDMGDGVGMAPNAAGIGAGHTMKRVNHSALIKQENALAMFWRHAAQASYWQHFAEPVRELQSVLGNREMITAIKQAKGAATAKQIQGWIETLATGGGVAAKGMESLNKIVTAVTKGNAILAIAYKLGTIFKQFDSGARFAYILNKKQAAEGLVRLATGTLSKSVSEIWKTDTVQRRVEGGASPEAKLVMDYSKMMPSQLLVLAEKGFVPMQMTDAALTSVSAAIVFDAKYREYIEGGIEPKQAEEMALDDMDKAVFETAQPAATASRSLLEAGASSNALIKAFMFMRSDQRLKFALEYEAWKTIASKDATADQKNDAKRVIVVSHVLAMGAQLVADLYKDGFSGDDDDDIYDVKNYIRAIILGPISGLIAVGDAIGFTASKLLGTRAWSDSENPIMKAMDFWDFKVDKLFSDDPSEAMKEWKQASKVLALGGQSTAVLGSMLNIIEPMVGLMQNVSEDDDGENDEESD